MRALELRHFRNLGIQELHFPPEGVAVVGDNAQGKTNLLEAIYYLESFRSFRGAADAELTAFNQDVFHLRGEVGGG
ncbi:MAG: DNA replication and repair protein RecF, partial [Gemmatimonadetes bacterium]|nr:DNA replication and repair protein RecF [Gemmatimonadota bacterium]